MSRIIIIGGPRTGKTTLANRLGDHLTNSARNSRTIGDARGDVHVRHTDDLIGVLGWSEASQKIADQWIPKPGPWIIEGVTAVRGIRKWLRANASVKPCDKVIVCSHAWVELSTGQASMTKGHDRIWRDIEQHLVFRGVVVEPAS